MGVMARMKTKISKHPVALIAIQGAQPQASESGANVPVEPKAPSARQQVLGAFSRRVVKLEQCLKEVRFRNGGVDLTIAKEETLKGFRGLGLGMQPGGRAKGKVSV